MFSDLSYIVNLNDITDGKGYYSLHIGDKSYHDSSIVYITAMWFNGMTFRYCSSIGKKGRNINTVNFENYGRTWKLRYV